MEVFLPIAVSKLDTEAVDAYHGSTSGSGGSKPSAKRETGESPVRSRHCNEVRTAAERQPLERAPGRCRYVFLQVRRPAARTPVDHSDRTYGE